MKLFNKAKSICRSIGSRILICASVGLAVIVIPGEAAQASTFTQDWIYALDSFGDATYRAEIGGAPKIGNNSPFEISAAAVKYTEEQFTLAINTNLGQFGRKTLGAFEQVHIGWGDIILDTAAGPLGIKFNPDNGIPGLYTDITVDSVTSSHDGWATNSDYINAVKALGGEPTLGDLSQEEFIFGDSSSNIITSGKRIGDILPADLSGLDFSSVGANGTETFGFTIDRSLLSDGELIATFLQECFNDGIAIKTLLPPVVIDEPDTEASVPEPSFGLLSLLGLVGTTGLGLIKRSA